MLPQEERPDDEAEDANRKVDVEDPTPRHVGDEPAADDRPERGGEHGRNDQHGGRLGALDGRERAEQHGGSDGYQHAATDAPQYTEGNELAATVRLAAQHGREREHRQREQEDLLLAA